MPIRLSGADYRRAHEACHKAALLWNFFLASIQEYWKESKNDPTEKEMRHFLYEQRPDLRDGLHAHTVQLILSDLMDSISTYRSNRDSGDKNARAPHREKNYRPLEFSAGFGWRVTPDGQHIALSFGKGHTRITLPLPKIADPKTGEILPPERWGSIQLCWDHNARKWSLHISVPTPKPPQGNPNIIAAIDEGIINPMTVAIETKDSYDVLVVNVRHARAEPLVRHGGIRPTPLHHRGVVPESQTVFHQRRAEIGLGLQMHRVGIRGGIRSRGVGAHDDAQVTVPPLPDEGVEIAPSRA